MPKGIPKNGINNGWIRKGQKLAFGIKCSDNKKEYLRKINTGKKASPEKIEKMKKTKNFLGKKHKYKSNLKNREKHLGNKTPVDVRKKQSIALIGEKSYRWKGGITSENSKIRHSIENRLWREAVFARDNWTCQNRKCKRKGGELNAHHIKEFHKYPELRFAIDNGKTLCVKCHKKLHKKHYETNNIGRHKNEVKRGR